MTRPALRGDPTPEQVRIGFVSGLVLGCVAGLLTLFAPGVWRYSGVGWAVGMVSALALMYAVGSFLGGLGS